MRLFRLHLSGLKWSRFLWIILIIIPLSVQGKFSASSHASRDLSGLYYSLSDTTLHEAVVNGNIEQVRRLIKNGWEINSVDDKGWTPLDYAKKRNRGEIRDLLVSLGAVTYQKNITTIKEGPHVMLGDSGIVEVIYLSYDSETSASTIEKSIFRKADFSITVGNITVDKTDIDNVSFERYPQGRFSGASKMLVIGDIHGELDRVLKHLTVNKIIDENGNWNWGDGHLIFVGDIFDRGNKVTEALWLIYALSKQAEEQGGNVHLILGNHEPMIFKDDIRYVTDEYYSVSDNLGFNYSELFGEKTLLGKWLRSMPIMLSVNKYGFVHAGISEEILSMEMELDTINMIVWQFLNGMEKERNIERREIIMGGNGPLWYRGFIRNANDKKKNEIETIEKALHYYDVIAFIVGHTEVDSISSYYNGRVIDVNIPKRKLNIPEQGLLITSEGTSVLYENRRVREMMQPKK